jgi:hypothetical protein
VDGAQFLPRPVQEPRIPIWCAAHWPNRRPLRRAARYDGVVPVGELSPGALVELLDEVRKHRTLPGGFDVALPSWAADGSPLPTYESAGVTWWLEGFRPDADLDTARAVIERGPPV